MKRIKIAVLMGGRSPEHEISLISGKEVVKNLPLKYEAIPIFIPKDGSSWVLTSREQILKLSDSGSISKKKTKALIKGKKLDITKNSYLHKFDLCFIALHGLFGEDGTMQGMLDLANVSYTGSGFMASVIGMNKLIFRKLLENADIKIPKYVCIGKNDRYDINKIKRDVGGFPYFIKPHNQGSSVGTSIVRDRKELKNAIKKAFKYSEKVLIDEYIKGIEVTCGILGNENPIALPLVEIIPKKSKYFDYNSKYLEGGSDEIVPARISKELTEKIKHIAIDVYKLLECSGYARVDFLLKNNRLPVVLEINTLPGLTPMSLLPKEAMSAGISYTNLLDKIIKYALEK